MGLDYSYKMGFRRDQLSDVLGAVGEWSRDAGESTDIYLPQGKITVPFTSRFRTVPVFLHPAVKRLQFDTSLYFPFDDEVIQKYVAELEQERVSIGYIYMNIELKSPQFVDCRFTAATTSMSRLFQDSSSVRQTFLNFARQNNAQHLVFDYENGGIVLWNDGQELYEEVADVYADDMRREVRLARLASEVRSQIEYSNDDEVRSRFMKSPNVEERLVALTELNDNSPLAFEALEKGSRDADAEVRRAVCELLGKSKRDEVFDVLLPLLRDENDKVREEAISAVYYAHKERAVEALIPLLTDSSPRVRERAASYLGYIGDSRATVAITPLLQDPDAGVRQDAINALGKIGDKISVEALCQLCADEAERISNSLVAWRYAFDALGDIGDSRALGVLCHILVDQQGLITNSITRGDALRAIEMIGGEDAIEVLELVAKRSSGEEQTQANAVLQRLLTKS